jgi:2-polyprenyl-3-methyl-5-hydroxy-6-metoxy-1,4-benzoquinol methylase
MTAPDVERLACPLCSAVGPTVRYDFGQQAIVRCRPCGMMWLYPRPTLDELRDLYSACYFENDEFLANDNEHLYGYSDYVSERINKQYEYVPMSAKLHGLLTSRRPPGEVQALRWLDVGCGLGYLLEVAFDQGFAVKGLEFNEHAVEKIRAKYTFDVQHGGIADLVPNTRFQVISLMDVIEHLTDPLEDLRHLRRLVAPDGFLVVSTMDSDSLTCRLLGKRLEDFRRVREHLYFFSRNTIRDALAATGWRLVGIESLGHTFRVSMLIDRIELVSPLLGKTLRFFVRPRWLLQANFYVNPRTKILIWAVPSAPDSGARAERSS